MNILPPWLIDVRVKEPESRGFRIWLPLVILWPLMLILGLVALIVSIVVDVLLFIVGRRYHHFTMLLARAYRVLTDARGIRVDVTEKAGTIVHVTIS